MANFLGIEIDSKLSETSSRIFYGFLKYVLPVWGAIALLMFFVTLILWRMLSTTFDGLIWHEYYFWWLVVLFIFFCIRSVSKLSCEVEQNTCLVYQNKISGSLNPKWPGFNWVGFFEYLPKEERFKVDTQKHNTTGDEGDWDTKDDTLNGKWKVLWRVDVGNIETRDENIRKYIQVTHSNIETAIKLEGNIDMTIYCTKNYAEDAKKLRDEVFLIPNRAFTSIESDYGIKILERGVEDLDYSKEVRDARKGDPEMQAFQKAFQHAVDSLMKSPTNPHGCTDPAEAQKIVKAKMLNGNYKQLDVNNTTGTPVVYNP